MYAQGSHNLIPLNLVLTIVNIFPTNNDSVSCPADLTRNKLILPNKMQKIAPNPPHPRAEGRSVQHGIRQIAIAYHFQRQ